ncbi:MULTISPECIES: MarR family winged helix-turn-helix transcriptional regulator [unclassified Leifsonia]|uniref:MarR family winged helix-turn-helix transcriptional regulator n=1 Tax=unclassified Leifsonia TaxID=2663824 RepID=UPI0006F9733B|nr:MULTISPECIES: MarR family transcriptional regulator [unclassified Leifsonia]KQX05490.1 MarR family transcriptional regulator [Leifsonia sp. Root1293]KRA09123.1 MarR family transcriptional regulator [Leifsonia sp. Root60]
MSQNAVVDATRATTISQILVEVVSASNRLTRVAARRTPDAESPALLRTLSVLLTSGPMRLGALADESRVSQPTMTKLVRTLVEREWVRRIADTEDARAWQIAVTKKGERAIEDWRETIGAALLPVFSDLSADEADTLARAAAILHSRIAREIAPEASAASSSSELVDAR